MKGLGFRTSQHRTTGNRTRAITVAVLECGHCRAGAHSSWHDANLCLDSYCSGIDCGQSPHAPVQLVPYIEGAQPQ